MDHPDSNRPSNAYQALTTHALSGFRLLAWANGIALLALVAFSLGLIGGDVDPPDLQQSIAAYTAGLAFCAVGMLFSYLSHFSVFRQIAAARASRGHWLPMLIAVLAYGCSVAAFVMGCWSVMAASATMPNGDVAFHAGSAARSAPAGLLAGSAVGWAPALAGDAAAFVQSAR
jgi:hypothetical protein